MTNLIAITSKANIETINDTFPTFDSPFRSIKNRGFYPSMLDRLSIYKVLKFYLLIVVGSPTADAATT